MTWSKRLRVKLCRRYGHQWGPWALLACYPALGRGLYTRTCRRCGEMQNDWRRGEIPDPVCAMMDRFVEAALGGGA